MSTGLPPLPPARLSIPTCIGCGAITELGTCETGCSERRLDLVDAADFDRLARRLEQTRARIRAFHAVAALLEQRGSSDAATCVESVQRSARRTWRMNPPGEHAVGTAVDQVTTWWCPACGAVDAPRPCIGVCMRRRAEYVPAARYHELLRVAEAERGRERALESLMRRLAHARPRPGQRARHWNALRDEAARVLAGD